MVQVVETALDAGPAVEEGGQASEPPTVGRLHADHVGPEIGEHTPREDARLVGEVERPHAPQRSLRVRANDFGG